MSVLGDVGLTLEIIGFIIFLFMPIKETFNLVTVSAKENKITIRFDRRYFGIGLIILGIIMQYSFFNL
ncbi:MAG: hypothetical protein IIA19_00810 [Thaumarchaeota archaeon]|nr:hypothetical protein [Nitrososphaerota archaeon]